MSTDSKSVIPNQLCPIHNQPAPWICGNCGKPLCKSCQPVGLNFKVYHSECVAEGRKKITAEEDLKRDFPAPSIGVRILGWIYITLGIMVFGSTLYLFGRLQWGGPMETWSRLSFIPEHFPLILLLFPLLVGVGLGVLGMGLLNCVSAARIAILIYVWFRIVGIVLTGWMYFGTSMFWWSIPWVSVFLLWFFMRKNVKRQFKKVL